MRSAIASAAATSPTFRTGARAADLYGPRGRILTVREVAEYLKVKPGTILSDGLGRADTGIQGGRLVALQENGD